jgi:hypothetical protein
MCAGNTYPRNIRLVFYGRHPVVRPTDGVIRAHVFSSVSFWSLFVNPALPLKRRAAVVRASPAAA